MKQSFNTSKLYHVFPIFILGVSGPELLSTISQPAVPLIVWEIGWSSVLKARKMRQTRLSIINSSRQHP